MDRKLNEKTRRRDGGAASFTSNFLCHSTGGLYETLDAWMVQEEDEDGGAAGGILPSWCGTSTTEVPVAPNAAALHVPILSQATQYLHTTTNSSLLDDDDEEEDNSVTLPSPSATSPTEAWPTKFKILSSGGGSGSGMTATTTSVSSSAQIPLGLTSSSNSSHHHQEEGDSATSPLHTTMPQQPMPPNSPRQNVVLKEEIMDELQSHLPFCKRGESFWLQYSLTRDGASLELLLNKVRESDTTILAIETLEGEVFGAFLPHAWKFHGDQYYGSGQSFLWRLRDNPQYPVQVFSFAHLNHNIQLMSPHHLILGGSGEVLTDHSTSSVLTDEDPSQSGFALWLQGDLSRGSSSPCSTFFSPCLSEIHADGSFFEIAKVEVWSLTPCMTLEQAKWLAHQKEQQGQRFRCPKVSLVSYCSAAAVLTPAAARPGHSKSDKDRMRLQQQQQQQDDVNLFGTSMMMTKTTTKTRMSS